VLFLICHAHLFQENTLMLNQERSNTLTTEIRQNPLLATSLLDNNLLSQSASLQLYSSAPITEWGVPDLTPQVDLFAGRNFNDLQGSNFKGEANNDADDTTIYANIGINLSRETQLSALVNTINITGETIFEGDATQVIDRTSTTVKQWATPIQFESPSLQTIQNAVLGIQTTDRTNFQFGLNFNDGITLKNTTLIVEDGDTNFNGFSHLENVTIVNRNGSVNLGDVQGKNLRVVASKTINMNKTARFSGASLLASGGNILFNGSTGTIDGDDKLTIVAQGNVIWNTSAATHAEIWAGQSFINNQDSSVRGAIYAQEDILLNARLNFYGEGGRISEVFSAITAEIQTVGQTIEAAVTQTNDSAATQLTEAQWEALDQTISALDNAMPDSAILDQSGPLADVLTNYTDRILPFPFDNIEIPSGSPPDLTNLPSFTLPPDLGLPPIDPAPIPRENQVLIGLLDVGIERDNPQLNYNNIIAGKDYIDGDLDPFLASSQNLEEDFAIDDHGTKLAEIIAAKPDGIGTEGINPDAHLYISRSVGSGNWTLAARDAVAEQERQGIKLGVLHLPFDLVGETVDAKGVPITRYRLNPSEIATLNYLQSKGILVVVSAGNAGENRLSALARAAKNYDNLIVIGAESNGQRAGYSNYGEGLSLVADGSFNPVDDLDEPPFEGTSVSAARVAAIAAKVWTANPNLTYRQVIDILQGTASDLGAPGWDAETGFGQVNQVAAIAAAANWSAPPSQLNSEPNFNDQVDELIIWATTYERPNGRCTRKLWLKLGRFLRKVFKGIGKVIKAIAKLANNVLKLFTKIMSTLAGLASKLIKTKFFKIFSLITQVLKGLAPVFTALGPVGAAFGKVVTVISKVVTKVEALGKTIGQPANKTPAKTP
jgi:hypothetical protein